jgi:anti-sigma factor RsiW
MTGGERPIGEDDLHAYVDAVLDPARRLAVDRYLADHPQAAARIAGWQMANEALQKAGASKAEEPVPAALSVGRLMEGRIARRSEPWRMAAGILIAAAVGASAGWMARGPYTRTGIAAISAEAAMAHRVFVADRASAGFSADNEAWLVKWATTQFGRSVAPPDLSKVGYQLVGGRVLATDLGPACMFLYEDGKGTAITLFLRPMQKRDMNAPMEPVQASDTTGFAWAHDGMGFSLVATSPTARVHELADQVRREMNSGTGGAL